MPIFELPMPPTRSDPANFAARGDAFLLALPDFANQANTLQDQVAASQVAAAANAALSAQYAGATVWLSGTTYAVGNFRYSPMTGSVYRRLTAGSGTVDPSADATNWAPITVPLTAGGTGANTAAGARAALAVPATTDTFGVAQWGSVTKSSGTEYRNTSGKPIMLMVTATSGTGAAVSVSVTYIGDPLIPGSYYTICENALAAVSGQVQKTTLVYVVPNLGWYRLNIAASTFVCSQLG